MSFVSIPLKNPSTPWTSFRMTLDGVRFNLEVAYNTRVDRWFLSIYDATDVPLLMSAPLLINRSLTAQYPTLPLPQGLMFVTDDTGKGIQPGLSAFLTTHRLMYQQTP